MEPEARRTVLFVCTANVCRSPMAETIFLALAADEGLSYEARSAGVAALVGEPAGPKVRAALGELGLSAGGHRARQVDEAMLEEADLVLAMTPKHAATLHRLSGPSQKKVETLLAYATGVSDFEGVPDPYGQSMTAHRASVGLLHRHLSLIVRKLAGEP